MKIRQLENETKRQSLQQRIQSQSTLVELETHTNSTVTPKGKVHRGFSRHGGVQQALESKKSLISPPNEKGKFRFFFFFF